MSYARHKKPVHLYDTNFTPVPVATVHIKDNDDREENLELIGAYLTDDFDDDFAEEALEGVA
jgi:hypothetical protein